MANGYHGDRVAAMAGRRCPFGRTENLRVVVCYVGAWRSEPWW